MPEAIKWSPERIASELVVRSIKAKKPLNPIQERVLLRLEIAMWIETAIKA